MTYRSNKWIQRDLEDQIAEEYKNQGKEYNFSQHQKQETMTKEIKISEVVAMLKQGYKRWTKEEEEAGKSIQSHFGLTFSEMQEVIKHPKVAGLRTKKPTIKLVDDTEPASTVSGTPVIAEVKSEPPALSELDSMMDKLFK